jgi:hypothetical protein
LEGLDDTASSMAKDVTKRLENETRNSSSHGWAHSTLEGRSNPFHERRRSKQKKSSLCEEDER